MSGIYIHIPFCRSACMYCNFHFSVSKRNKDQIIAAILREIELKKDYLSSKKIDSVYFGGGTPSYIPAEDIALILGRIREIFEIEKNNEITVEANPDDLNDQSLEKYSEMGVNRLSIGIQSFDERNLEFLGRKHSSIQAEKSIILAKNAGFKNLTIDLIYGIPGSDMNTWSQDLQKLNSLGLTHFSAYALTLEPNTIYSVKVRRRILPVAEDELVRDQFFFLHEFAEQTGFRHYEISNFTLPGFEAKHNSKYWEQKEYLGIGPSAHSFNLRSRQWNPSLNSSYLKMVEENRLFEEMEKLSGNDAVNEKIMLGLRTANGLSFSELKTMMTPDDFKFFHEKVLKFEQKKLLTQSGNRIYLTLDGMLLADAIISELFID